MKKSTKFIPAIIILTVLLIANIQPVFADDGSSPPEDDTEKLTEEKVEPVEVFEENENTETFEMTGEELPEDWVMGGDAELTAESGIDEEGDGWLRLTDEGSYEKGFALYDQALETEDGVAVNFDYASWGGSGADGITFFLVDGETEAETFNVGGDGGSLGYAPRHSYQEGLDNAVVGVGLDEFGNFANKGEGRKTGTERVQDSVTVRGEGDGFEGYEFIENSGKLEEGIDTPKVDERPDQEGSRYRNVSIIFEPIEDQFALSMRMQFGADSTPQEIFNQLILAVNMPQTVKMGFSATTGGADNIHEIRNIMIDKAVIEEVEQIVEEIVDEIAQQPEQSAGAGVPAPQPVEITVPVTFTQSEQTLVVIPVTSGEMVDLDCNMSTRLEIEEYGFAELPAMCEHESSLQEEPLTAMPSELSYGEKFMRAMTLQMVKGSQLVKEFVDGTVTVGFPVEACQNLQILFWEEAADNSSGAWIELAADCEDGFITADAAASGLFVLVSR